MRNLNTNLSLETMRNNKKLQKIKSYWMWVKYEFWKEPELWISDIALNIKITCLSGKREYQYAAPTIADVISNAESLFGEYYFKVITKIIIFCDTDESLEEIEKHIIKNIK